MAGDLKAEVVAHSFHDIICRKCGEKLDTIQNSIVQPDVITGGWKGHHKVCPAKEQPPLSAPPARSADWKAGFDAGIAAARDAVAAIPRDDK